MPALALLVAAAVSRLSPDVTPTRYALELDVHDAATSDTYAGRVDIALQVAAPVTAITLHARDLKVTRAGLARGGVGGSVEELKIVVDAAAQTITLPLARPLDPKERAGGGLPSLSLEWTATYDQHLRGLYKVKHNGEIFLGTQLEAIDARRMFPCFDEPAMKAVFEMTVAAARGVEVITNTRPVETKANGKGQLVHFAPTPPISTYLVALAVGPYGSIHERIKVRKGELDVAVWTPRGQEHLGRYALAIASEVIPWYERWFDQPFPFEKLDLVDVPDFEFGAMENAGAIFFVDAGLLVDEKRATPRELREVANDVTHELAHQWFGDLVTMRWWDDLWLNESFATWLEHKSLDALRPALHATDGFQGERSGAFADDALGSTHAVRQELADAGDFESQVDSITYAKGASVLGMLETYLGADGIRAGLRRYMAAHRYANATAEDLWAALDTPEKPVRKLAHSWIDQPGYPIVDATLSCEKGDGTLSVRQRRFFADPDAVKGNAQTWQLPLCARTPGAEKCTVVDGVTGKLALGKCPAWVDANPRRAGFYRVRYGDAELAALSKAYAQLEPVERLALLDDEAAFVEAGLSSVARQLPLVEDVAGELSPLPLESAIGDLRGWDLDVVAAEDRPAFARAVERILGPSAKALGWRGKPGEPDEARRARHDVLVALGSLARPETLVHEARERVARLATDPVALEPVEAEAAIAIAATSGDAALWEKLYASGIAARTPQERGRYLFALSAFEAPELVQRTLDLALSGTLRQQENGGLIAGELSSRHGRALAWAFVQKRWTDIAKSITTYSRVGLVGELAGLCSKSALPELQAFLARPELSGPELSRARQSALEGNRTCAALAERSAPAIHAWLAR